MRRLLRDIAEGRALGDTTTLADASVVAAVIGEVADAMRVEQAARIKEAYEEKEG
jgi:hypothetical protein